MELSLFAIQNRGQPYPLQKAMVDAIRHNYTMLQWIGNVVKS